MDEHPPNAPSQYLSSERKNVIHRFVYPHFRGINNKDIRVEKMSHFICRNPGRMGNHWCGNYATGGLEYTSGAILHPHGGMWKRLCARF
ncbi:hypothetical protein POVWA2_049310 [Plasmodium ovale wallikeri]|uniref:Uncharacterized protein n=1 Tax=Plasmodium ovale wallikeri TaxID=864142 RepID=A0A1A8ZM27_PLAOA|nr:hypothetical protein POVWA1_040790 [Plasmodium ovale wallikeri]SBT45141.1 hypothetical protein POVWA2_049310 [Plasmodium ovale wallikeri]